MKSVNELFSVINSPYSFRILVDLLDFLDQDGLHHLVVFKGKKLLRHLETILLQQKPSDSL